MPSDAIAPVTGAPGTAPAAPVAVTAPPPGTVPFAALLDAQQQAPADLPTLTFGQMLGLTPVAPPTVTPAAAAAAPTTAAAPPAADGAMAWPVQGRVTSEFGPRVHPITGVRRNHDGIDIAATTGTPITAASAGTVTFAGQQGGYGNIVIIDHGNGTETRYAHQDTIGVTVGQKVAAGERVGTVGSTGLSTGPHLHFEVRRNGTPIDPRRMLG